MFAGQGRKEADDLAMLPIRCVLPASLAQAGLSTLPGRQAAVLVRAVYMVHSFVEGGLAALLSFRSRLLPSPFHNSQLSLSLARVPTYVSAASLRLS